MGTKKDDLMDKVMPLDDAQVDKDIALLDTLTKPFNDAREKLIKQAVLEPEQLSFLPTKLCRTTIFFPLPRRGRKKLQAAPIILNFKTKWGRGEYEGRRLSVDDEDILMVCLYLADKHKSNIFLTNYTEIQRLLRINKPHPKYNGKIKESFTRFGKASFFIEYADKADDQWSVDHILKARGYKGKIRVTLDSDFYNEFLRSYTLLSMPFRMKLSGDLSKLLFTFLSSHRSPVKYFTDTLAEALNMNKEQERKYLVKALKAAFKELQSKGFLVEYDYNSKEDIFTMKAIKKKEWKRLK
jgi:hypothetical protein